MSVVAYLARRAVSLATTLLLMSVLTFLLIRFVPGDPIDIMYGTYGVDPAARAELVHRLGLDQPLWVQYSSWLGRMLTGDFGSSYRLHMPVTTLIQQRLPATLLLAPAGLGLAVVLGIPLGVLAAVRRESLVDLGVMAAAVTGLSVPAFALGIVLALVFGLGLRWFPTMGYPTVDAGPLVVLWHLVLPAITLAAALFGWIARLTRSTVLEALSGDYVRTAYAKGLSERAVVFGHVLKNALLPVVTLIGLQAAYLIGGTVVVEVVFAWPGIGSLVTDAILGRDYPVVQAVVLLVALFVVLINLLVDVIYSVLDPRIRLT